MLTGAQVKSCNALANVGGTTGHLPVRVDVMMGLRGPKNRRRKTRKPVGCKLKGEAAFQDGMRNLTECSNLSDFTSELTNLASKIGSSPKPSYTYLGC